MEALRVIGYWGDAQQSDLPHPSVFVDLSWDADEREAIAYYLGRGVLARAYMGYSPCRLCDKRDNGNLEFSDGTYVWPQGLVHYVTEHGVRLPAEFVQHAFATEERLGSADRDINWWRQQG